VADDISPNLTLQSLARALGGVVCNGEVLAPGPGHSPKDRSLSVKLDPTAQDGFVVHSFAGDDPLEARDYVREKCGLPAFRSNGGHKPAAASRLVLDDATIAVALAAIRTMPPKARGEIVKTYDYTDADGTLLYQICRFEPKDFRQRRPNGNGGWTWNLDGVTRVPYRLPDLIKHKFGTVFVTEGEKDADRLAEYDLCATTVASGKWEAIDTDIFAGRDVMILEDNDDTGRKKALDIAKRLHGITDSVRIVRLPGLPEHGDVSDWFDRDRRRTMHQFTDFCFDQPLFSPDDVQESAIATAVVKTPAASVEPATPVAPTAPTVPAEKPKHSQSAVKPPAILRYRCHRDANDPTPKYLVKNLLPETGMGLLSGQWGTYKSFIALKLAGAIATAQPFAGYAVKRQGAILYLACEGAGELPARLEALSAEEHGNKILPIYYCDASIRLLDHTGVASIIATAKQVDADAQRDHKLPLVLIVIDTVISAAAFAKTGDENDSTVGAKLMAALSTVSQATGTFVLGIDHFGKVAETGTRGTSAKEDAADVVLALLAAKSISGEVTNPTLCVRKRRGGPAGIEHPFKRKAVTIGEDEDGEPVTSLTIEFDTIAAPAASSDTKWTRSLGTLRRILMTLLADAGEDVFPFADGPMVRAVRLDLARSEFYRQYVFADGDRAKKMTASRKAFHRAVTAAKDRGLVVVREIDGTDFVWLATSDKP